jgi:dinuclear metal center YbgI/SA1388 family protein
MRESVSLLAYHLPLDAHPELGNNRQLADRLGFVDAQPDQGQQGLFWRGRIEKPLSAAEMGAMIGARLNRRPLHIGPGEGAVERIGWCTGAAQGAILHAVELGLDAFVTGEVSEQTVHQARELGVHFFAAGHHATERYGVMALGERLAEVFSIEHRFIDIPNPV